jgi:chorismate-pyruvate lyase
LVRETYALMVDTAASKFNSSIENTVSRKSVGLEKIEFNPMGDLLIAQSRKPPNIGEINLRALTAFQRALLVIDGTVTKFIEAYTMEPVDVVRLGQETRRLSTAHASLEAPGGTPVLFRQVMLRGKYSYTFFAYAASLIVPERLDDAIKSELMKDGEGIGRILLNSRIESRREVLWYGKEHANDVPAVVRRLREGEYITRTYRIVAGGRPIVLINERFPYGADQLPARY